MSGIVDRVAEALRTGRRITPSAHDPWHGDPLRGSRWTRQQVTKLKAEGRNPDTIAACQVPLQIQNRADWTMPAETRLLLCPMLAKARSGRRALIISPAGDKLWMDVA